MEIVDITLWGICKSFLFFLPPTCSSFTYLHNSNVEDKQNEDTKPQPFYFKAVILCLYTMLQFIYYAPVYMVFILFYVICIYIRILTSNTISLSDVIHVA